MNSNNNNINIMRIKDSSFLVCGQLKTSRTETLEEYLGKRAGVLGVIGFMSPFATHNESRATLYKNGDRIRQFSLFSFLIKRVSSLKKPLIFLSFFIYIISIFYAVLRLNRKFTYFIGIATFSSAIGIILKRLRIVDKVIYYCIDYYPPSKTLCFDSIIKGIYKRLDVWLVRNADVIWEISSRIKEGRYKYTGVKLQAYGSIIVPLGYSDNIYRDCPFEERERWTLGFVGTISENQGLQMIAEAIPSLIEKIPEIRIKIIGTGPYLKELTGKIKKMGLEDRFIFKGFIRNDEEVYDILSRCMVGLATWTGNDTDNSVYADPGKPKLYALLGLPIIITDAPYISIIISETGAGEVIKYNIQEFVKAVVKIIGTKESFFKYKDKVYDFKGYCLSESIFNQAFKETFKYG